MRLKSRFIEWRLDFELRNASDVVREGEINKMEIIRKQRAKIDKFLF